MPIGYMQGSGVPVQQCDVFLGSRAQAPHVNELEHGLEEGIVVETLLAWRAGFG